MKNLSFGIDEENNVAKKCHQIHVGKENVFCPPLKAHSANIKKAHSAILSSSMMRVKLLKQLKTEKIEPMVKYLKS